MPRFCFAPGCKTGYKSDRDLKKKNGEKVTSLYGPPKNLLEEWRRAVPRADRVLHEKDSICALHFKKEDIEYEYEVKLANGKVWRAKKTWPTLRKGAVPCIFPNLPKYLSSNTKKRKPPAVRTSHKKTCFLKEIAVVTDSQNCAFEEAEIVASTKIELTGKEETSPTVKRAKIELSGKGRKRKKKGKGAKIKKIKKRKEKENFNSDNVNFSPSITDKTSAKLSKTITTLNAEFPIEENASHHPHTEFTVDSSSSSSSVIQNNSTITLNRNSSDITNVLSTAVSEIFSKDDSNDSQEMLLQDDSTYHQEIISLCNSTDQEIITDQNSTNSESGDPHIILLESLEQKFTFYFLKANVHLIDKHNSWWILNVLEDFIICARWNSDFIIERKIVIKNDLTVKVFLLEKETLIGKDLTIDSFETVSKLIYRVERSLICPGIFDNDGKCHGFLQGIYMCKKKNLCVGCIQWEKEKVILEKQHCRDEKKLSQQKIELIQFHFNT